MYDMSRQHWITSKYKYYTVLYKTNKTHNETKQKQHNHVEKKQKERLREMFHYNFTEYTKFFKLWLIVGTKEFMEFNHIRSNFEVTI